VKVPRILFDRWDDKGRVPWWARLVWPRLHFCAELDGLLFGDESPDDEPFLCGCLRWPIRFHEHEPYRAPSKPGGPF